MIQRLKDKLNYVKNQVLNQIPKKSHLIKRIFLQKIINKSDTIRCRSLNFTKKNVKYKNV